MNTVRTKLSVKDIMLTKADRRALDALQVRNLQQFRGWTAQMETDVVRAVSDGVTAGENIDKISGRISDAIGASKTRARRIARTESINAAVEGARNRYREYGIEQVEVIACDDWRTCKICQQHDGKIYSVDDDAHMPPYHPNCRCAIKAVVKKEKEPAKKAPKVPKVQKEPQVEKPTATIQIIEYAPAATIKEAEAWARKAGITRPDYKGVDLSIANVMNQRHAATVKLAPKIKDSVTAIGSMKSNRAYLMKVRAAQVDVMFHELRASGKYSWASDKMLKTAITNSHPLTKAIKDLAPSKNKGTMAYFSSLFRSGADGRGVYVNMEFINELKKYGISLEKILKDAVLAKESPQGCDTVVYLFDHEYAHVIDNAYALRKDPEILREFNKWRSLPIQEQIDSLCGYAATCAPTAKGIPSEFIAECWGEFLNNPTPRETSIKVSKRILDIIANGGD